MTITKEVLRNSLISGFILGTVALVPFFILYVLFFLFFFSSAALIFYMKKYATVNIGDDYKKSAVFGAVTGSAVFLGFIAVFIPCTLIISFIFKNYYNYGLPYLINFQAIWLFLLVIIMVAAVCASTNAVSAMGARFLLSVDWENILKTFRK